MHKEVCCNCNLPSPFWAGGAPDLCMPQDGPSDADLASDMAKVEDGSCVLASRNAACPTAIEATAADIAVGVADDSSHYW